MTQEQNTTTEANAVHHQTRRAADTALAKRTISPDSHKAVHEGRISLGEARELGREGSPYGPAPKTVSKNDRSRDCLCLCGNRTRGGRFIPGHDQRLVTYAKEYVRGERELTEEQTEYVQTSGKLDRAKAQVEKEERRREEVAARKAQKQREKEGETERRKAEKEANKKLKK